MGRRTARGPRRPRVVWHVHDYVGTRPATARFLRWSVRHCDAVVANSRASPRTCTRRSSVGAGRRGAQRGRPAALHPVGRAARSRSAGGTAACADGHVFASAWSARSADGRGTRRFSTPSRASAETPSVRAYVIGGALVPHGRQPVHARGTARTTPTRSGSRGRVGFTGFVEAADEAIRALDIVVHASTAPEPFGLVIAEAMACGRAVIASDAGGAREIFTPGVDALAHTPGDSRGAGRAASRELAARSRAARPAWRARRGRRRNAASIARAWPPILRPVYHEPAARGVLMRDPSRLQRQPLRRDRGDSRRRSRVAAEPASVQPRIRAVLRGPVSAELDAAGAAVHQLGTGSHAPAAQRCRGAARARRARPGRHLRSRHLSRAVEPGHVRRRCSARGLPLVFWAHDVMTGRHWTERLARRAAPDLAICNSHFTRRSLARCTRRPVGRRVRAGRTAAACRLTRSAALRASLETHAGSRGRRAGMPQRGVEGARAAARRARGSPRRPGWIWWQVGGAQRPHERAFLARLRVKAARERDRRSRPLAWRAH